MNHTLHKTTKKSPLHLVIPMSGQGTRYQKAGYHQPKPLIPVSGVPMIARLLEKFPAEWPTTFVMAENHRATDLPQLLTELRPRGRQLFVPVHSQGPSYALMAGISELPADARILVSYCDYGLNWDPWDFDRFVSQTECDACVVSYRGFHAHYLSPVTYAYSKLAGETVQQVKEKGSFTSNREEEFASCGAYYFRNRQNLQEAIAYQISNNLALNGEYYTSLTTEALLQKDPTSDVRVYEIPAFFQWGTPEDLQNFEYWEKTFESFHSIQHRIKKTNRPSVEQVLMPMAGLGSRFAALTELQKPLIPVIDQPMYQRALASLPQAPSTTFVTLEKLRPTLPAVDTHQHFIYLKETPSGQALSTEAGLHGLNPKKEVFVSSCDHEIVLDPELWSKFQKENQGAQPWDAAILTVKGFPGTIRRPQAYAYVRSQSDPASIFEKTLQVSVKTPLSDRPSQDPLLVGTFWFRSTELLKQSIQELKAKDLRVNGELYLDSVFNLLIEKGLRICNLPLDGYINWGDPDSLAEGLYWYEIFSGKRTQLRKRFEVPKC